MSVEKLLGEMWSKITNVPPTAHQMSTFPQLRIFCGLQIWQSQILPSPPSPTPSESQFVIENLAIFVEFRFGYLQYFQPPPPELELLMENLALLWPSDLATSHHS